MMPDSKRDVAKLLHEGTERRSVRAQLRQHERTRQAQQPQRKKRRDDWER